MVVMGLKMAKIVPKIDYVSVMGSQKFCGILSEEILREIFAGKSSGKILWENLAGKSCREILAGNSCWKFLWEILVLGENLAEENLAGKSCGKFLISRPI